MVETRPTRSTAERVSSPPDEGAEGMPVNPQDRQDRQLRKSSSLNSMFICTTINKPCVDSIINAVATILNS